MKNESNRTLTVLLTVLLALTLAVSAFALAGAGTSESPFVLSLGSNETTLWTLESPNCASFYTFTPAETDEYVIRSESGADSVPHLIFDSIGYYNWLGSGEIYCKKSLTANTQYTFNIYDENKDSSAVTIVIEKYEEPSNVLSLGDNALSLNRKAYAQDYSFTPAESGVYEFTSSGYGQPGCLWGDEDFGAEGLVGETYSWQFRFEKELTAGTTYLFKPYNQSGTYEGVVTITKKDAPTTEIDAISFDFATTPALCVNVGDAALTVPANAHYSLDYTWTDHNGVALTDDDSFRCGLYYLAVTVTPDQNYVFSTQAAVTYPTNDFSTDLLAARSLTCGATFNFGDSHTYGAWEEMSNIQIAEAGFGEPYEGKVWEYRVCEGCLKTQYRGGDCPEISSIILAFSAVPTAGLDLNDIDFTLPYGQPLTMAGGEGTGWIGTFNSGSIAFLCGSEYTAFSILYPTAGHTITADNDLEILVECDPLNAVTDTDYELLSSLDGVYVDVDFRAVEHVFADPVWSWKADYTEAYAVFACLNGDREETVTVLNPVMNEVSAATYTQDQIVKYTATAEFQGETYEQESGNVTVTGSAAALLAADTATFGTYKAGLAAELDELAEAGDSAACLAMIENAKASIIDLAFDCAKTLDENKAAADAEKQAAAALLAQGLVMQRANEAEFEAYKAEKAAELDALMLEGDSAACRALIEDAKSAITDLEYDAEKSLEENKQAVDAQSEAVTEQLTNDLAAQREADANKDSGNKKKKTKKKGFFARLLESIRSFFSRLFKR